MQCIDERFREGKNRYEINVENNFYKDKNSLHDKIKALQRINLSL